MFTGVGHGLDDLGVGGAGAEQRGDALFVEDGNIGFGDDAADDDRGACAGIAQCGDDARCDGEVRAVVHRDPDDVDVLVSRDGAHGCRSLTQSGVDHLHARVAQRAGNDLDAAVVTIEPDFGNQDATAHATARSVHAPNTISSAAVISPTVTCARTASRNAGIRLTVGSAASRRIASRVVPTRSASRSVFTCSSRASWRSSTAGSMLSVGGATSWPSTWSFTPTMTNSPELTRRWKS